MKVYPLLVNLSIMTLAVTLSVIPSSVAFEKRCLLKELHPLDQNDLIGELRPFLKNQDYFGYFQKWLSEQKKLSPDLTADLNFNQYGPLREHIARQFAEWIHNADRMSRKKRFELIREASRHIGPWALPHFEKHEKLTRKARFELAKALAHKGYPLVGQFSLFGNLTQKHQFELAKIIAIKNSQSLAQYIKNLNKLSRDQRFQIALIVARNSTWGIGNYFKRFGRFTQEQRFQIIKVAAAVDKSSITGRLENFGKFSNQEYFEIAKISAKHSPLTASRNIQKFRTLTAEQQYEVAQIAAASEGSLFSIHVDQFKRLTTSQKEDLYKTASMNAPFAHKYLENYRFRRKTTTRLKIYDEMMSGPRELRKVNEQNEVMIMRALPYSQATNLLRSESKTPQNLVRILESGPNDSTWMASIYGLQKKIEYDLGGTKKTTPEPEHWASIFTKALGLDPKLLPRATADALVAKKEMEKIVNLAYEIQRKVPDQKLSEILPNLEFTEETLPLWNRYLSAIRDELSFSIHSYQKSHSHFLDLRTSLNRIDPSQSQSALIKNMTQIAEQRVEASLSGIFRLAGTRLQFRDFKRLKEKWGDIESVKVLLARFYGNPNWHEELEPFFRLITTSLDGTFKKEKFGMKGKNRSIIQRQLASLKTAKQRNAWIKDRVKITSLTDIKTDPRDLKDIRKSATREAIKNRLFVDINHPIKGSEEWRGVSLKDFFRSPRKWVEKKIPEKKKGAFLSHLLEKFKFTPDLEETRELARGLNQWISEDPSLLSSDRIPIIRNHLKLIQQRTRMRAPKSSDDFAVTVFSSDPRFLLEIGNLVKSYSCQNPTTGEKIGTLLAYLQDGNIKAMATFGISAEQFKSPKDYQKIKEAFSSGSYQVQFDGNRKVLNFKIGDERIQSRDLGDAYLRNIVKLGETENNRPSPILERDQYQMHLHFQKMNEKHREMVHQIREEMSGEAAHRVNFPPTSNPGGVHSDLNYGTFRDAYSIDVEDLIE